MQICLLVVSSFERNCVKFGALLCSKVGRNFGAILKHGKQLHNEE